MEALCIVIAILQCHGTLNVYEAHAEIDALAQLIRNEFGECS